MKRTAIAIALPLLGTGSAFAQSSVTLYGLIDAGVSYVSNQGGHSAVRFDDGIAAPNLWGITGAEDLGGGTKAIFKLENQFVLGSGATMQPGIFGREAWVGLEDARFGKLILGNVYDFMTTSLTEAGNSPAFFSGGLYNFASGPFQKLGIPQNPTGWFDWARTSGQSLANSVKYQSPTFAGVSAGALYAPGGVAGSFGSNSAMSFGLRYAAGPFGIGAAYTRAKYPGSASNSPQIPITNWGVGAHYPFGPVYTVASFVTVRNSYLDAAAYAAQFAANWRITPVWSLGAGYQYMKGNAALDDNHANQFSAVLNYALSKRTSLYAEGVYQRANAGAQAAINGLLNPADASSGSPSQAIARIGLSTTF